MLEYPVVHFIDLEKSRSNPATGSVSSRVWTLEVEPNSSIAALALLGRERTTALTANCNRG